MPNTSIATLIEVLENFNFSLDYRVLGTPSEDFVHFIRWLLEFDKNQRPPPKKFGFSIRSLFAKVSFHAPVQPSVADSFVMIGRQTKDFSFCRQYSAPGSLPDQNLAS